MHTRLALAAALAMLPAAGADADLVISQLIIDFKAKGSRAQDIEVLNRSEEQSYVSVEASLRSIRTKSERRTASPDPAKLGLLVSPTRFVLEPAPAAKVADRRNRLGRRARAGLPSDH